MQRLQTPERRGHTWAGRLKMQAMYLGVALAVMWALAAASILPGGEKIKAWGILPRQWWGLPAIIWAPLLHDGLKHVAANSVPFFLLGLPMLWRGPRVFWTASILICIVAGLGAWTLGAAGSAHIGVSGLVFGYFGFLLARAMFDRSFVSLGIAALVGIFYGGLLWSLFSPDDPQVSWQMHLFGFVGGVAAAWITGKKEKKEGLGIGNIGD